MIKSWAKEQHFLEDASANCQSGVDWKRAVLYQGVQMGKEEIVVETHREENPSLGS